MHELSIVISLLDIAREELKKHGASKLKLVRVRVGALSNVVPEALEMAFETATMEGEFFGAKLEITSEPLVLRCGSCGQEFTPEDVMFYAPCPHCGYEFMHDAVKGGGIYLDHLEAE